MSFEITGKLEEIFNTEQKTDSFRAREFILYVENETNSNWADHIKFQLTQDRCSIMDNYAVGDKVKVSFNISGRKYERDGRVSYFNNLTVWRVDKAEESGTSEEMPPISSYEEQPGDDSLDDLPF